MKKIDLLMTKEELNTKNLEDIKTIAMACGVTDVDMYDKEALIDKLIEATEQPVRQENRTYEREKPKQYANAAASQARDILDELKAKKAGMTLDEYRQKQWEAKQERQKVQREQWEQQREQRDQREQREPVRTANTANSQARDILDQLKAKKAGMTLEEYRQSQGK